MIMNRRVLPSSSSCEQFLPYPFLPSFRLGTSRTMRNKEGKRRMRDEKLGFQHEPQEFEHSYPGCA